MPPVNNTCIQEREVNTHTDWVHSYRMEHAKHFPAPMEMCMDDHHTQTTERTQRQHLHDIGHTEFPPGRERTPVFQESSSNREMKKSWIQVHLHQGALLQTGTLCSAHSHTQGEFHKTSNNWRWKIPTQWHFHASITMLRQPHTWKLQECTQQGNTIQQPQNGH